ncbi:MAG TPA: ABC transporter substrate-binding protein, partial [Symbiobacteriaceae bacterium]|nr:ABC transporter substrate-binding protein [Symbiobacteriaceae bacterium]
MNFSAKRIFGLLALSVMLVATGCGGSAVNSPEKASATQSTPAAAPAKAPEPAHQSYTIKVSGTDRVSLKHLPMFLSSFGKQDGISVDFKEFSGGTKAGEALLNKDVDFSILQVEHVLRDTSGEMRIVGLFTRYPGLALLVNTKYKDQIATLKDLVGKKVGVSGVGGASHQFLLILLKQNGIDPSSITILPVGLNATEVFAQDKVMATVSLEPFVTQVVTSGQAVVLVDSRKPDGTRQVYGVDEIAWHALVTRPDVIQNNPKMVNQ